jgi:hypothetical protein
MFDDPNIQIAVGGDDFYNNYALTYGAIPFIGESIKNTSFPSTLLASLTPINTQALNVASSWFFSRGYQSSSYYLIPLPVVVSTFNTNTTFSLLQGRRYKVEVHTRLTIQVGGVANTTYGFIVDLSAPPGVAIVPQETTTQVLYTFDTTQVTTISVSTISSLLCNLYVYDGGFAPIGVISTVTLLGGTTVVAPLGAGAAPNLISFTAFDEGGY